MNLTENTRILSELYRDLAFTRTTELTEKKKIWEENLHESVQLRDRYANYGTVHITSQILTLEAEIKVALLEREDLLRNAD